MVPGVGWTSHVGDIRLIVLPQFRGQGIGRRLAAGGQELAESLGMSKLMIEIIGRPTPADWRCSPRSASPRRPASAGTSATPPASYQDLLLLSRWLD